MSNSNVHRAAAFAARAHAGQVRKDNVTPYISHVGRVALICAVDFGVDDDDILAAAWLHDVIEDTPADYDDIAACCNERVADLVSLLSKDHRLEGGHRDAIYHDALVAGPWEAKLVKLADSLDNARDAVDAAGRQKCLKKLEESLEIAAADERCAAAVSVVRTYLSQLMSRTQA